MVKEINKDGDCPICHRLHDINQACPRRIANAYMMLPQALEQATLADRKWMADHPAFSVLNEIEDIIADML